MSLQTEPTATQIWAYKAVYDFTEKYSRATEIVNNLYDISGDMLVTWITLNGKRWKNYKKACKYVSLSFQNWSHVNPQPSKRELKRRIIIELGHCHLKLY